MLHLFATQTVVAAGSPTASAMQAAAQSRQVPLALVEATAYINTGWEWIPTPSQDGGVGPMNIRLPQMSLASSLSGHSQSQISNDLADNLDAGAALLAHFHASGTDLANASIAGTATVQVIAAGTVSATLVAPKSVVANQPFNVVVTLYDRFGNASRGLRRNPALHDDRPRGAAAGQDAGRLHIHERGSGSHTFSVTLMTPVSQTITVTDTANAPLTGTSKPITGSLI